MKKLLNVLIAIGSVFFFISCDHPDEQFVGPAICPPESFRVINALSATPNTSVDLKSTEVAITASFTESIEWKVYLTGRNSGAIKMFTGKSDNIHLKWIGEFSNGIFFRKEEVRVELIIACKETQKTTIDITNINDFNEPSGSHVLLADFEGFGITYGWSFYAPTPTGNKGIVTSPLIPPQGSYYAYIKAKSAVWYAGDMLCSIPSSKLATISSNSTDDVYFNALVNSGENKTTILQIIFQTQNGNYQKSIYINWKGWKWISFKLSELQKSTSGSLSNISDVTGMALALNAYTKQAECEAAVDFPILTVGKPFNQ